MARLGVNIDHVATVRQARRTFEPDPAWAAVEAQLGGADGITFHLREDRRHINDRDAAVLKEVVHIKLNMEMSIAPAIVRIAQGLRPEQCTLVPERREELTTEGGLDVIRHQRRVAAVVKALKRKGIEVSAFIEPIPEQVRACAKAGFQAIELWTGGFSHARPGRQQEAQIHRLAESLDLGCSLGLAVHAGHGLTYDNIRPIAAMGFEEFNIGHSIMARAMFVGLREAVRQMRLLAAGQLP